MISQNFSPLANIIFKLIHYTCKVVSLSLRYVSSQFFFLYHIYIHTYIYICYLVQSKDRHRRLVNLHVLETFILTHCQSFYNVSPFFFFFYPLSNTSHSLFFSNKKKSLSSLSISFVCLFVFLKRKKWIRMQKIDWSKTVLFYEQFVYTMMFYLVNLFLNQYPFSCFMI